MTYDKPEVTVLGRAAVVIEGAKTESLELNGVDFQINTADCELDD